MLKSLYFSSGDNYVATLTLGGAGAHATYYHKANDQVPNISISVYMDVYLCISPGSSPRTAQMQHFGVNSDYSL